MLEAFAAVEAFAVVEWDLCDSDGGWRVHLRRSHGRESDLSRDSQRLARCKECQGRE